MLWRYNLLRFDGFINNMGLIKYILALDVVATVPSTCSFGKIFTNQNDQSKSSSKALFIAKISADFLNKVYPAQLLKNNNSLPVLGVVQRSITSKFFK